MDIDQSHIQAIVKRQLGKERNGKATSAYECCAKIARTVISLMEASGYSITEDSSLELKLNRIAEEVSDAIIECLGNTLKGRKTLQALDEAELSELFEELRYHADLRLTPTPTLHRVYKPPTGISNVTSWKRKGLRSRPTPRD